MALITLSPESMIAHRGHQALFPENSSLAILDAIAAGALNIEFDVQLTEDGIPVLYHDDDMMRISGAEEKITRLKASDLLAFSAKEPKRLGKRFSSNPIESLDDILPLIHKHKQIRFFLEMKEESLEQFGEDVCLRNLKKILTPMPDNVTFISFSLSSVRQARKEGFTKTALVFRDWDNRNSLLAAAEADYGFINYTRIPKQEPIEADKPIFVYEVTYPLIAQQLLERGAAGVETFNIRALLNNS